MSSPSFIPSLTLNHSALWSVWLWPVTCSRAFLNFTFLQLLLEGDGFPSSCSNPTNPVMSHFSERQWDVPSCSVTVQLHTPRPTLWQQIEMPLTSPMWHIIAHSPSKRNKCRMSYAMYSIYPNTRQAERRLFWQTVTNTWNESVACGDGPGSVQEAGGGRTSSCTCSCVPGRDGDVWHCDEGFESDPTPK